MWEPGDDVPDVGMDRSGTDPHGHLVVPDLGWIVDLPDLEDLGRLPVPGLDDSSHNASPVGGTPVNRLGAPVRRRSPATRIWWSGGSPCGGDVVVETTP